MSNQNQMNPELAEALKASGFSIVTDVEPLTVDEQVKRIMELNAELEVALEKKDLATAKKIRRILRTKFHFSRREWKKNQESEAL